MSAASIALIIASSVASTVAVNKGSIAPDGSRMIEGGGSKELLVLLFPRSAPWFAVEKAIKISPDPLP